MSYFAKMSWSHDLSALSYNNTCHWTKVKRRAIDCTMVNIEHYLCHFVKKSRYFRTYTKHVSRCEGTFGKLTLGFHVLLKQRFVTIFVYPTVMCFRGKTDALNCRNTFVKLWKCGISRRDFNRFVRTTTTLMTLLQSLTYFAFIML